MAGGGLDEAEEFESRPAKRRSRLASLAAKTLIVLVAVPMLALVALGLLLDTDLGHRLIIDRIAAMTPDSGLRVRIGRIDGSIWGETELRDLRLYDQDGLFAEAPQVTLEWRPLSYLRGDLVMDQVASELAIVHRPANFIPSSEGGGVHLPDFDVHVGRLDIAQLRLEPAVAGARRALRLGGEAEYRSGRFLLGLDAAMRGGGDRLELLVDAFPEQDRFDLDLALDAPADGVLAKMLGTTAPLRMALTGDGSWRNWDGRARVEAAGRPAGDLMVTARSGRYRTEGWLATEGLISGPIGALASPRLALVADGRFEASTLSGRITGRSAGIRFALGGGVDFGSRRYRELGLALELLRPAPLLAGVQASAGARLTAMVDGPFDGAALTYRAAAAELRSGTTVLDRLEASGSGGWSGAGLRLPIAARAARLSGDGNALLDDLRLNGSATIRGDRLSARNLQLEAGRARTDFSLDADLATGRFAASGTASAQGYEMARIGLADIEGEWRATSQAVNGQLRGTLRRIDQAALAWAARGPLRFESALASGPGRNLAFAGVRLAAPGLQLQGSGLRAADGGFSFHGQGRQAALGPLRLDYQDGRLALRLARPAAGLGLADVSVEIVPAASGFGYRARGRSPLGPFAAQGDVRPGADEIRVAALSIAGAQGRGNLRATDGGVAGRLDFSGALAGPIAFGQADGRQTVTADLVASDATVAGVPIGSGRIAANLAIANGAALSGRVRFDGAADRLWRAAGIEAMALTGPLRLEAELGGTLAEPSVAGRMRLAGGRLIGASTAIDGVQAAGTFDLQRLSLASFSGRTQSGGRIEGAGTIGYDGALDLRLTGEGIALARGGMESEWRGRLRVAGTASAPRLVGEADLVRGTYRLFGRSVELRRGTMRFDGSPDPLLDIVTAPPGGFGPGVRITGRASRPEIGVAPLGSRAPLPALPPRIETAPALVRRGRRRLQS